MRFLSLLALDEQYLLPTELEESGGIVAIQPVVKAHADENGDENGKYLQTETLILLGSLS